jgi:IS30 family transposase
MKPSTECCYKTSAMVAHFINTLDIYLYKSHRKHYGSYERRGRIKNTVSIEQRSEPVNIRSRIGDWEGDTVHW